MFDFSNISFDNFSQTQPNVFFIVLMGIGTVFVGLICLIVVCKLFSLFFAGKSGAQPSQPATAVQQPPENKQEILAAVSAAVAEELGTDVNGIRITSFKKL